MSDDELIPSGSALLLYQTEDGKTRLECRFDDETIWLSQLHMAELFQTKPQNITFIIISFSSVLLSAISSVSATNALSASRLLPSLR